MINAEYQLPNGWGHRRLLFLLLFSLIVICQSLFGQTGLKIQLVSEQSAIVPGRPFTMGLWIQHDRGWHTYWRFPGIVGVPTQMKWNLPKGWQAGPLVYPEPERTRMFEIKAQGFDRDVMLRTEVTPPADLRLGESVTLSGKASWMCCGNSCHPGVVDLSLTLPVASAATLNEKWHVLFEAERSRAENTSDAWKAEAAEKGSEITLTLRPADQRATLRRSQRDADRIIVFTEDGWFDSDKPQTITLHSDGTLSIRLVKADTYLGSKPPAALRCILRHEDGWVKGENWRCLRLAPFMVRLK
jgi:thiol:disulfide interchange protein DsbD